MKKSSRDHRKAMRAQKRNTVKLPADYVHVENIAIMKKDGTVEPIDFKQIWVDSEATHKYSYIPEFDDHKTFMKPQNEGVLCWPVGKPNKK